MINVDDVCYDIEVALEQQLGSVPLPFPGMDKSVAAVCVFFARSECDRGPSCPYRHISSDRTVVCKHWLRGLCKKGDQCEFLHEYDMTKMPECYFYSKFNACHNKECPFLHIDPKSKIKDCPWYDRGFCRHGPNCRHRHTRRVMCANYLAGFCPEGGKCKFVHPRFDIPVTEQDAKNANKVILICHYCGETGHKATYCHKMPQDLKDKHTKEVNDKMESLAQKYGIQPNNPQLKMPPRPISEVTCYKCGTQGHYANRCPKGHLAFLSSELGKGNIPIDQGH